MKDFYFDDTSDSEHEKKIPRFTVSELTLKIKSILEREIDKVEVEGELSNFRISPVGHSYFCLKDESALINCVMFRASFAKVDFSPKDGMSIIVKGRLSVYEVRGYYQIIVEEMEEAGLGELYKKFIQLKNKLEKEGLFDKKHKKKIPYMPTRIGIVTSPTGAAIRDIINVISRRFANCHISLFPSRVQGDEAPPEIIHGIEMFNKLKIVEVIIIGRGGGSLEDLWAFNDEGVARAIFKSAIPIISAVGHERDFTIADFVADLRAPTPSAAAELVVQNAEELFKKINSYTNRLNNNAKSIVNLFKANLSQLTSSYIFKRPFERVLQLQQRIDDINMSLNQTLTSLVTEYKHRANNLSIKISSFSPINIIRSKLQNLFHINERLNISISNLTNSKKQSLKTFIAKLYALNPRAILSRGYSIFISKRKKRAITDSKDVKLKDFANVIFHKGEIEAMVTNILDGQQMFDFLTDADNGET